MTLIKKLICDVCGKEKDLLTQFFNGVDTWQTFLQREDIFWERIEKHVCSTECAIKFLKGDNATND